MRSQATTGKDSIRSIQQTTKRIQIFRTFLIWLVLWVMVGLVALELIVGMRGIHSETMTTMLNVVATANHNGDCNHKHTTTTTAKEEHDTDDDTDNMDNDYEYYKSYPASRQERNKTAELLYLVWGGQEKELDVKRKQCADMDLFFAQDKILPETFEFYHHHHNNKNNTHVVNNNTHAVNNNNNTPTITMQRRKIPKIIHISSKLRCMTEPFHKNLQRWQNITGYSVLFHDDEAVYRLVKAKFTESSKEIPNLEYIMTCMKNRGAMMSDLVRTIA